MLSHNAHASQQTNKGAASLRTQFITIDEKKEDLEDFCLKGGGATNEVNTLKGVHIRVLNNHLKRIENFLKLIPDWEEMTGATVELVSAESRGHLDEMIESDLRNGTTGKFDGYVSNNMLVPYLAQIKSSQQQKKNTAALLELDALVMNSPTLKWMEVHPVLRNDLSTSNGHVYSIPFDGDVYLLYYRRDLRDRDGWDLPRTWDELIDLGERYYHGQDLNDDGIPDYAMCTGMGPTFGTPSIIAVLSGLLQTHPPSHPDVLNQVFPKRHGVFFELAEDGLEPLVDNAAMRRVLRLMYNLFRLGPREILKGSRGFAGGSNKLFRTGRCAFYLAFPSVGEETLKTEQAVDNQTVPSYIHGRMGTAQLPGWTEYLDRKSGTLQKCTIAECPVSIPLDLASGAEQITPCALLEGGARLNRAAWYVNGGGYGGVVNSQVDPIHQIATFDLFAFISSNIDVKSGGLYNTFRYPDHFAVSEYAEVGWDPKDAFHYLDGIMRSLNEHNPVVDLRVPYTRTPDDDGFIDLYAKRFWEYYVAMNETTGVNETGVDDENAIMEEAISLLDNDIREWISAYDNRTSSGAYWMGIIEKIYRESLNLPLRSEPGLTISSIEAIRWYGWSLAALMVLSSALFAAWTILNRKRRLVRAAQPFFLLLITAGTFVMGLSLIPLGIDQSLASDKGCSIACMAYNWLVSMGFTMSFSALYCKVSRINKLFSAQRFHRIRVQEKDVIAPFLGLFTLNFAVLLSWSLVDPHTWQYKATSDNTIWIGQCSGESSAATIFEAVSTAINWAALVLANIQSFKARRISVEYSESKYIAIALALAAQVLLFTFPLTFLVEDNPKASYFMKSTMTFIIAMSLSLCIFVPKMLLLRKEESKKTNSNSSDTSGIKATMPPSFASMDSANQEGARKATQPYSSTADIIIEEEDSEEDLKVLPDSIPMQ